MNGTPPGALLHAFVLHRRDHGDTSLLIELFTAGRGRFPAIAKGARRPRHPTSALLQPFQPLWVDAVGRGEVRTLTRVEAAGRAISLHGRPLLCGFYLNELMMRLLGRDDPHDPLFAFYHGALSRLAAGETIDDVLRQFELSLLGELGYAPDLAVESEDAAPVRAEACYRLDAGQGPCRTAPDDPEGVSGATLLALAQATPLSEVQRREARALLRRLLEPHLGGRPLKSRALFQRAPTRRGPAEADVATGDAPQPSTLAPHRPLES